MGNTKIGNNSINSVYFGNTEVVKIYYGSTLVYEKQTTPAGDYYARLQEQTNADYLVGNDHTAVFPYLIDITDNTFYLTVTPNIHPTDTDKWAILNYVGVGTGTSGDNRFDIFDGRFDTYYDAGANITSNVSAIIDYVDAPYHQDWYVFMNFYKGNLSNNTNITVSKPRTSTSATTTITPASIGITSMPTADDCLRHSLKVAGTMSINGGSDESFDEVVTISGKGVIIYQITSVSKVSLQYNLLDGNFEFVASGSRVVVSGSLTISKVILI